MVPGSYGLFVLGAPARALTPEDDDASSQRRTIQDDVWLTPWEPRAPLSQRRRRVDTEVLALLLRWLGQPPASERCPTCDQETGDPARLTPWPQHTHCPHCGADLCPF